MTDQPNPNDKGYTTRKTNQLAGARIALPGHDHTREEVLRAEFIADFKPKNRVEMIWVGDIAYCLAAIEVKKAQIAGFYQLKLRTRALSICTPNAAHIPDNEFTPPEFDETHTPEERETIAEYIDGDFHAAYRHTLLASGTFALLLGSMNAHDSAQLRLLEQALHDLMRERDRIIHQLDRRRQQPARDAILKAQARLMTRAAAMKDLAGVEGIFGGAPAVGLLLDDKSADAAGDDSGADDLVADELNSEKLDESCEVATELPEPSL
jgi:hypothetical protein